ncbi:MULTISPECIES: DNA polymerase III subunit alpha [unclassified Salinibacterium]|uniref:DNA polymerase III subunit alpha n=1 Tax=unclassified Salinibacterium TaxID=2632331 RepID=UPI0018CDECB5|nr:MULTISPECIES: DNA polymerase III subunit alpha [unclassified Salinibacterium]MBH0054314.1 DNA polymerase III subunit alpha [Salinibacterium sp. SWN139]MBH0083600.1 DNA polymerase III subunit alpha [Salinibacterium sp. SWN167]MBH0115358.1 DNA polymerase III subunit alpha [Salinibacterium sp. NG253]
MAANNDSFVHLHVHSEYSMLDGAARVGPLLDAAVEQGMPAIAITDHGNMFGAYDFWKQATARGIKPIIGTEAYVTPGTSRRDKTRVRWGGSHQTRDDVGGSGAYTHMTLLAQNNEGMHNLFRLSSRASIEGFYFKPRMDRELLSEYSKGITATTGCVGGEVQTKLRLGLYDEAKIAAAEFQDIFGKENFFAEIMDHGIDIERRTMLDLLKLAKELDMPLLATNDLHYTHAHDATAHAALLCVQSASTLDDPNRFKFDSNEFYLKTAAEMRSLFREHPEACDNTLLIAERSEISFEGRDLMPRFPVPEGETEATWFEKEVARGMNKRFNNAPSDAHLAQAKYEVDVIQQMGFPGYFLVVADFIEWAKSQGIRVGPGRGSAAGSMASYAVGITELDPLAHGLIFERFLNPERVSMPDVDVDFDDRRRGEVIRYVTDKYGDDRVAQIVTYGTIKAKQALKDSARVLGMPYSVGEKLTKAMPPAIMGKDISLGDVRNKDAARYKEAADIRGILDTDHEAAKVFETAVGLEGLKRQWGVHAAGVVLSAEPLLDVLPIMRREDDGAIITQFDQPPLESLGLIKMDFLGLRNLTVIEDALKMIEANTGSPLIIEDLDLDADQKTYDLLARGDTLGVFQLDGGPMRALLKQLKPTNFEDISAVIALYRPGPMGMNSHTKYALRKNGLEEIDAIHAELEEPLKDILGTTFGLIVYQEQVMSVAQKVAGFTLGQADVLRRAMGKKKKEELDKQFLGFETGMLDNGFSKEAVKVLWETLMPFADYAFNKAHSAGYGVLSYWTAYLKANYPAEYMAALLTSVGDSKDKLGMYLSECRRMGIKVLAPDVNESTVNFTAVAGDIRFGLGAVRNVGAAVVEQIVRARTDKGRFESFHDFLRKVSIQVANKRTVESLIKSGAFDSLGATRRGLLEIHEDACDSAVSLKRNEANGQVDLFGGIFDFNEDEDGVPERPEWSKRDKLAFEREMLGLYVSDHPLSGLEIQLAKHQDFTITEVLSGDVVSDGEHVSIAGLVTSVQHRVARNSGNQYGIVTVEDFAGEIDVMFLGKTYQEFAPGLVNDSIVVVRGRASARDDGMNLHAVSMFSPDLGASLGSGPIVLTLKEQRATTDVVSGLGEVLIRHSGTIEVRLRLVRDDVARVFELPYRVKVSADLYGELKSLLGPGCLG